MMLQMLHRRDCAKFLLLLLNSQTASMTWKVISSYKRLTLMKIQSSVIIQALAVAVVDALTGLELGKKSRRRGMAQRLVDGMTL